MRRRKCGQRRRRTRGGGGGTTRGGGGRVAAEAEEGSEATWPNRGGGRGSGGRGGGVISEDGKSGRRAGSSRVAGEEEARGKFQGRTRALTKMKGRSVLALDLHLSRSSGDLRVRPSNFLRVHGSKGSVPRLVSASTLKKLVILRV
jgi:hypothetical protein